MLTFNSTFESYQIFFREKVNVGVYIPHDTYYRFHARRHHGKQDSVDNSKDPSSLNYRHAIDYPFIIKNVTSLA